MFAADTSPSTPSIEIPRSSKIHPCQRPTQSPRISIRIRPSTGGDIQSLPIPRQPPKLARRRPRQKSLIRQRRSRQQSRLASLRAYESQIVEGILSYECVASVVEDEIISGQIVGKRDGGPDGCAVCGDGDLGEGLHGRVGEVDEAVADLDAVDAEGEGAVFWFHARIVDGDVDLRRLDIESVEEATGGLGNVDQAFPSVEGGETVQEDALGEVGDLGDFCVGGALAEIDFVDIV